MPELGESVHEGTVSRWLKNVGDPVKEDEAVVEIMTDKVNTELQAPAAGVLVKILIPEGENVKVFEPLGLIGESMDAAAEGNGAPAAPETAKEEIRSEVPTAQENAQPQSQTTTPEPVAEVPQVSNGGSKKWYTPVVRSMAKQAGVSDAQLASIAGTGEGGRVTKKDLAGFLAAGKATSQPQPVVSEQPTSKPEIKPTVAGEEQEVITLVGIRKAIADAMVRAHETPSVSTVTAVDVSKLVEFRKVNKESFQEMNGVKLTYTPFFIKALAEALIKFPYLNSGLQPDGKLVVNHAVHMGIAVALGDGSQGLVVPVLRDAHKKNLIEIAKDLEAIAKKARDGKLEISDYQGATFSVTNPGTYGALFGTPMIPAGQSGILGTYAIQESVVAKDGMFAIRPIMHLVLSYDHRVVDGMLAGAFLKAIRDQLESFDFFR
jgi:pyruvate/2-oxoglutarate dehydrogenase complex dihydrolipoamide acyltransferase (E2) component